MTRNLTILFLLCVTIGLSGCGVEGLHSANPRTIIQVNPWTNAVEVYNNKDVDVSLKNFEMDIPNKVAKVEELTLKDNASKVREVNPLQIDAVTRQSEVVISLLSKITDNLLTALMNLNLKVGGGGGWQSSPATADNSAALTTLSAQIKELQQAVLALKTRVDASQPSQ